MTSIASASNTAERAKDSTWLAALTRAGFLGYGILHLAIAWIALQIAFRRSGHSADQAGAFQLLKQQPLGEVLLVVIAVGLAGMAVWQLLLAAVGHHDESDDSHRTRARLASAGLTIVYGYLCVTCIRVLAGSSRSSSSKQEQTTGGVLAHPFGRWLVAIAGLAVIGGGIGMIVYGVTSKFRKKLELGTASRAVRGTVTWLGRIGYAAKGVAFGIVGVLLFSAALSDQASRARGLDGALRNLAGKPYGTVLLILVALGFVGYGLFGMAQARYRKV
jgi:hypothetical protein